MSIDLWADTNAPRAQPVGTTYKVSIPQARMLYPTKVMPYIYLEVDKYGVIGIDHYRSVWFGHIIDSEAMRREIIDWLVEWDFAEWKPIGDDQHELFATSKLTGEEGE